MEKAEKVVNPPQKPTTSRNLQFGSKLSDRSESPINKPIRRQPKTFTARVPQGKLVGKYLYAYSPAR